MAKLQKKTISHINFQNDIKFGIECKNQNVKNFSKIVKYFTVKQA
jgi:hypothetical protein